MYDFHYNYIKPQYDEKAKVLYSDTESLIYEIKAEDFYEHISGDVDKWFDTSDYPAELSSVIRTGVNKKLIGKFKDEAGGKQIEEFVALRPKPYWFKIANEEHKKCKGIKQNVVDKNARHEKYTCKNCLFTDEPQMRKMIILRSDKPVIYSEEANKIALSADDDKQIIMEDGISTLAYGHYDAHLYQTVDEE